MAQRPFVSAVDADPVEFGRHASGTRIAPAPDLVQALDQFGIGRIHTQADDVHGLVVAPGNRYLDPVDKAQPDFIRGGPCLGQAAEFVVVGQRHQFHAI
jgi:hypothetical protein